jgi:hypothetical protein
MAAYDLTRNSQPPLETDNLPTGQIKLIQPRPIRLNGDATKENTTSTETPISTDCQ